MLFYWNVLVIDSYAPISDGAYESARRWESIGASGGTCRFLLVGRYPHCDAQLPVYFTIGVKKIEHVVSFYQNIKVLIKTT